MSQSVRPIVTDGSRPARMTSPAWKTGWPTFSIIQIIITTLALKTRPVSRLGRCTGMLKDCVTKCWGKAFFYERDESNCTVMAFNNTRPNPNFLLRFPDNSGSSMYQVSLSILWLDFFVCCIFSIAS